MKYIELQEAFELEITTLDKPIAKPTTSDMTYWFNAAIDKFIKSRAFGNNFRREAFEQTQKRIDDLRTLVKSSKLNVSNVTASIYSVNLPSDYMHTVGESAYIVSDDNCWPKTSDGSPVVKRTDVLESSVETVDRQLNNTFSEHQLRHNSARPLRVYSDNKIILYTDGKYRMDSYELSYIKLPEKVILGGENAFQEYTDLPKSTHLELVKLAAQMYIENQSNPRYQTYANEVASME